MREGRMEEKEGVLRFLLKLIYKCSLCRSDELQLLSRKSLNIF